MPDDAADSFCRRILPTLKEEGFYPASEFEHHKNNLFGPIWFYETIKAKKT